MPKMVRRKKHRGKKKPEELLARKNGCGAMDITPFNAVMRMNNKDMVYPIWPGYGNIYKT